ncbi:MAG: hypothetical protein K9G49_10295 [Taibaiella sp.]|nr:hypothetical protein [Taibaiella sp.]
MKKYLLSFIFILSVSSLNAQNYFLATSADGVEELYIMSVTSNRTTQSITVFDRVKPVEGKLPEFRHNAKKDADKETDTKNFDKLGYYRRKIQYSCHAKKYRIMEVTYNELGGKVIEKVEYNEEDRQWSLLLKGSLIEAEFNKVCKK